MERSDARKRHAPKPDVSEPRMVDLIDRSSLGAPDAKALRATVSDEQAAKVLERARELSERDELAQVLAAHVYVAGSDGRGCLCGWRRRHGDDRPLQEQHADSHLADAILAAGWRRT